MITNGCTVNSMYGKPIEILLVEDDLDEASLTIDTLKEGRVRNHVTLVEDGVDAITFLRRQGNFANAPRPDLILLDLKLRRKHGKEVLAEIKADPELKSIPVIIMSKSSSEQDISDAYNLHANCYIQKPLDLNEFILSVRRIEEFWISFVKLPTA